MELRRRDTDQPAMGTKMKGAIVRILRRARLDGPHARRIPGARGPRGYVRRVHTEFKKMFKGEPQMFGPRLNVAKPAPLMERDLDAERARLVALTMNSLSPASARAACIGRPVTVTVADQATAVVFRKALDLTIVDRPTDRLIDIKVRGS